MIVKIVMIDHDHHYKSHGILWKLTTKITMKSSAPLRLSKLCACGNSGGLAKRAKCSKASDPKMVFGRGKSHEIHRF